jgi:hypothetical protein
MIIARSLPWSMGYRGLNLGTTAIDMKSNPLVLHHQGEFFCLFVNLEIKTFYV